ncbi:MAG: indolepyruvate ferredoxin oxidoreductase subunit alpha [Oscillospiraceae bacterium]
MKQLLIGNGAVARGLYEAGCRFVSSYPGTPSTEITEEAVAFKDVMHVEWAPNEKVALESAVGASLAGARAFSAMKHVGLNVAADSLYTISYTGVSGGLVIAVADDMGMYSSQNEQDSRHHAIAAKVPMLEPFDSQDCLEYTKLAFELSEEFDTPVMLRTCTRVAHSQSLIELHEREERELIPYKKNPQKNIMLPANAIPRHAVVEERTRKLTQWAETSPINRVEMGDPSIGFVTAGGCYGFLREAFPEASILKLGMVNPLPVKLIEDFAAKVELLVVVEELDPIIENHCKVNGIHVDHGKDLFGLLGELSQTKIASAMGLPAKEAIDFGAAVPGRPPVLCPGCPHRGTFYVLSKMWLRVFGDIGCYTLGALPPLFGLDTCYDMGASITGLHGFNSVLGESSRRDTVAVMGDSTFCHSGITGLLNVLYNGSLSTILVLDNAITGMTGHQQNPCSGSTLQGDRVEGITVEKICEGLGVKRIKIVDPYNIKKLEETLREELDTDEVSVIICRRPCALLPEVRAKQKFKMAVNPDRCKGCKSCMRIGCPSISFGNNRAVIDPTLCVGCALCAQLCAAGAISVVKEGK